MRSNGCYIRQQVRRKQLTLVGCGSGAYFIRALFPPSFRRIWLSIVSYSSHGSIATVAKLCAVMHFGAIHYLYLIYLQEQHLPSEICLLIPR